MNEPIAIVGMACRYPDADDPTGLWETVLAQRRAFRRLPRQRLDLTDYWHPDPATPDTTYSTSAAVLADWQFDRAAFRIPGQVFRATDPAHWLALETAGRALADANHPGLDPDRVGVVIGNSLTGEVSRANALRLRWPYVRRILTSVLPEPGRDDLIDRVAHRYLAPFPPVGDETLAGGLANTIAGRICNHFDFHGGGYTVDGACASSMLAVITLCRALGEGSVDFGIAGGVDLSLDPFELVGFAKTGALATDEMRIYDEHPTGFWPGEGCGMLALMRAADARSAGILTYAEIRGWGMSSDGHGGITRPEVAGQVLALRRASTMAGIAHADVRLYEGHGTGTAVGDLVELTALNQVRADAEAPAALGSVKANIGHTKAAAGVAGVIKTALSLAGDVLPPTTGCRTPHPALGTTLRTLAEPEPWPPGARLAGVSAMGFGGINTHLLLARDPARPSRATPRIEIGQPAPQVEVLALSGRDTTQVRDLLRRISAVAPEMSQAELHDLACHHGRLTPAGRVRVALTVRTPDELATKAAAAADRLPEPGRLTSGWLGNDVPGRVTVLFAGQGIGADVDTALAQPAIHRAGQAAIDWLDRLGVTPVAAIGHSLGEITALVWAGCLSAEDGARLVAERGRIMAELGTPDTGMLSVATDSADELCRGTGLVVAAYNGPRSLVLAGPLPELRTVTGIRATLLPVSHAFHSPAMARCVAPLRAVLDTVTFRPPSRAVLSTVYGRVLREDDDLRELLAAQLLAPVLFGPAVELAAPDTDLFCTVGPGQHTAIPAVSLNQPAEAAAALFAASAVKDLAPLFAGRSARPFDVWRDRTFLANPCSTETPLAIPAQRGPTSSVIGLIADAVELDPALIRPDTRLLNELNLGSLRTTQLLTDAATALGRQSPAAWGAIADLTVAQVIETVEALPLATDDTTVTGVRPWLGCFTEALVPATVGRWRPTEHVYLPDATDIEAVLAAGRTALRAKALVVITPDSALTGFLRSLWLEHPSIGITVVRDHRDSADHHAEPGRWRELVVGPDGIVREPVERPLPMATEPLPLTAADVLLVSGGGRGIGHECARALAMASGAALAIIGRADPATDDALRANLDRLRADGIRFAYRSADVSLPDAAVTALAAELGQVTALLHASGVNEPTTFDLLDAAAVRRHIAPKVAGLRALLAVVPRPRLVITFGSVIGRFGLHGECHYALANGLLRVEAERLAAQCRVLHIDWSVWSGTGMGERLGVVDTLNRNGITPIPTAEGTDLLLRLLRTPTATAVSVHGRLAGTAPIATTARFLQQIRVHEPEIELVADAVLSLTTDPDLAGHQLDGATVLPGVLGLEAMAQAASTVAGRPLTTAERVAFDHPILLPTTVRVCALRRDDVIETVLRTAETGYRMDHFRAEFPLCGKDSGDPLVVDGGDEVPAIDLYGPVFFHTGRFQRIASVFLPGPKACRAEVTEDAPWFASVLGAPTMNDATIHALQACVPHRRLLPVGCDRVEIQGGAGPWELHGIERHADGGTYTWDVVATDRSGRPAIRWTGLRLRDVGSLPRDRPWPPALLAVYLARCAIALGLDQPATTSWAPVGSAGESAARDTAITRCRTELGLSASGWRRTGSYDGGWEVSGSDCAVIASVVLTVVGPGTVAVALAVRT
jgi:enediyne polyketide synthase